MDLQAEKRHLIEQLSQLQDINIIQKVKDLLDGFDETKAVGYDSDGQIITKSDLISRAEASNKAIEEGRTKSLDQVRTNMKSW